MSADQNLILAIEECAKSIDLAAIVGTGRVAEIPLRRDDPVGGEAMLRERLFVHGPVFTTPQLFHPQARYEVVQGVADELGISSEQVETTLFADRPATYLLTDAGPEWTPAGLLARYNLELARGVLYWASHIRIEAASNYKDLWKYIKFFKLMFWAEPKREGGYRIDLDGPISPFVSSTMRYGRQMAAFLPALLLCEQWRLLARVRPPHPVPPDGTPPHGKGLGGGAVGAGIGPQRRPGRDGRGVPVLRRGPQAAGVADLSGAQARRPPRTGRRCSCVDLLRRSSAPAA